MSQAGQSGSGGGGGEIIRYVPVSTFQPNNVLAEFDDFMEYQIGNGTTQGKLNWSSTGLYSIAGTSGHPGIASLAASVSDNNLYIVETSSASASVNPIVLGGGLTSVSWIVQLSALSTGGNNYTATIGMADGASVAGGTGSFVSGVYFQYNHAVNGGNWTINCTSASVTTTTNTSTAADTSFHVFSFTANSNASSVSFYIDNVLVGSITTNIPSAAITPTIYQKHSAGTIPAINIDLFYIYIELTVARTGPTFSEAVVGTGQLIEQYTATNTSYQVLNSDAIIGVTSTAAARTITMPASSLVKGQRWTIKDESGGAATNNITISGNGKNIDAAATYVINSNYGSVDIYYNGVQFYII